MDDQPNPVRHTFVARVGHDDGHHPGHGGTVPRARVMTPAQVGHRGTPDVREREFLREGFGAQLRALRLRAGLTQVELGRRAGVDRLHLSRLELGRRRPESRTVRLLVAVLVPPAERAMQRKRLNSAADTSWREWRRRNGSARPIPVTGSEIEAEVDRMIDRTRRGVP